MSQELYEELVRLCDSDYALLEQWVAEMDEGVSQ